MRCLLVVFAGAMLTVTGCSSGQHATQARPGHTGFASSTGNVTVFAPAEREQAPALSGKTLDDKTWSLSDQRGKVVVLNVWGSWCPPCRKEAPDLVAAAKELGPSVRFIGLNTRELTTPAPRRFVAELGLTYPSLFDPSGKLLLGFGKQIRPSAIPTTLVIDKNGKVAARVLGEVTKQTLIELVNDAG
jgi:thiol-disulfide isomerase/thioredoxin